MNDLASNLFVLFFLLAYTVVFLLLLRWTVRRWLDGRRKHTNTPRHLVTHVASELRRRSFAGPGSLSTSTTSRAI